MTKYQEQENPKFPPISEGIERPFWSVMIPTYNCRKDYLAQTLESVLAQDPGSKQMQIAVIDNCSTQADSESLVAAIGKGRVDFYRQHRNVGLTQNFNTCISRSVGKWVQILHDDDLVEPGFYSKYEDLIERFPDATLLTSPVFYIDENNCRIGTSELITTEEGIVWDFLKKQALMNRLQAPSVVIPRTVYENIGGYNELYHPCGDWDIYFRAAACGQTVSTILPYSCYRIHESNDMNNFAISGDVIRQGLLALNLCFDQLSVEVQRELKSCKFVYLAELARHHSIKLQDKHPHGSLIQATWAFKLNPRPRQFSLYINALFNYYRHTLKEISIRNIFSKKTSKI
jgi:glycosyltransferase involved in cell wall biosynthesis